MFSFVQQIDNGFQEAFLSSFQFFYYKKTWQIFPKVVKLVEFALETQNCPKTIYQKMTKFVRTKKFICSKESALRWVGPIYHSIEYELFTFVYKKKKFQRKLMILSPPSRLGVSCELDCKLTCKASQDFLQLPSLSRRCSSII